MCDWNRENYKKIHKKIKKNKKKEAIFQRVCYNSTKFFVYLYSMQDKIRKFPFECEKHEIEGVKSGIVTHIFLGGIT